MSKTVLTKKAAVAELKSIYNIRTAFAEGMSADQVRALLYAIREDGDLAQAIRTLVEQRNYFASNNKAFNLKKYRIENERDHALDQLNYVEQQLEEYQRQFKELLQNFLNLERSEILRVIRTLLTKLD